VAIVQIHPGRGISKEWVQGHVEFLYGFRLDDWQLEDLCKLLNGGIYSVMYPTDFGKSMLIEIYVVLSLIRDHRRRKIVIKINESAAEETASELALKLEKAATHECPVCGYDHAAVRPKIAWRNGEPYGISSGFWIAGAERDDGRNTNKSVRCYGIGSRDLQGKRGDTCIDDLERREEATSQAERKRLVDRVSAVMRTLEDPGDDPYSLWAMFGTPQHEESVYYDLTARLAGIGIAYEQVHRPLATLLDTPFGRRRRQKMEIHRRTMSKSEWQAAYELRPRYGRMTRADMVALIEDRTLPKIKNERQFYELLKRSLLVDRPTWKDVRNWEREVLARLADLEIYIGWDPATTGDWACAVVAILGRHAYVLRTYLGIDDSFGQASRIRDLFLAFPSAAVVIEKNGQQKAFKDIFEVACPEAKVFGHGTFENKDSDKVGIPALMEDIREGYFHLPFADEDWAEEEFGDLLLEFERYGPTAHPHIIPAIWFPWHWSRKHSVKGKVELEIARRQYEELTANVRIQSTVTRSRMSAPSAALRSRSQAAWSRHHRR
jgi:hypothetical protein